MIKLDTILKKGKSHKICEDYIIRGYDPFPYIILSDGCSSSDDTDIGARILCHLAKQFLQYYGYDEDMMKMGDWIIYNAELTARQLGLRKSCLDATLIVAVYVEGGSFFVYVYGDGCVITLKDNRWVVYNYEYSNNTPFYLSYQIDPERREIFDGLDGKYIHTVIVKDNEEFPLISKMPADTRAMKSWWGAEVDLMLICSDGISSFLDTELNRPLEIQSLIESFTSFKNTNGEFLKRRLLSKRGAITKLEEIKVHHLDDLSIGAFLKG